MSDSDSPAIPTRRDLRTGNTGAIVMPDQPPQSRRERKLREHLIETGALPAMSSVPQGFPNPTVAPSVSPPDLTVPQAPAPPQTPVSPVSPTGSPPLTRRQLREQLRMPATDSFVPPSPVPSTSSIEPSVPPQVDPAGVSAPPPSVIAPTEPSSPASVETTSQVTPLPPVFAAPLIQSVDSELAQSRSVGPAAPATNALILPVAPPMDMTGPLGDTGEVLVTGNIPLPRHVVETGITGVIDVDVDDDDDFINADSGVYTQPIRAVQAVSSRSLELEAPMIKKPRWGAMSLALGISAAVLGVTAVSLLALALLTDIVQLPL